MVVAVAVGGAGWILVACAALVSWALRVGFGGRVAGCVVVACAALVSPRASKTLVAEVVRGLMGSPFAAARPLGCVNSCGGGMGSIGVAVVGFHMGDSKGRVGLGQHTTLEHQKAVRRSVETASSEALPLVSGSRGC